MIKICIGIPVYRGFYPQMVEALLSCLLETQKKKPDIDFVFKITYRTWLPYAHRRIVHFALREKAHYILFVEEDIVPPRDGLLRLLKHNVDCVLGLYWQRSKPYAPVIAKKNERLGVCEPIWEVPPNELIEIDAGGLGFCLLKTEVFKDVSFDSFHFERDYADDIPFFLALRKKGYKVFCDTSCICQHVQEEFVLVDKKIAQDFHRQLFKNRQ
ncbi:hypothetical protein DRN39_04615 [Thermococci archaeon]|nr:MAG: hypothetical protein DRN39_04615 [Thermococci archaeon]